MVPWLILQQVLLLARCSEHGSSGYHRPLLTEYDLNVYMTTLIGKGPGPAYYLDTLISVNIALVLSASRYL